MPIGSRAPLQLHNHSFTLSAGTELFHVYPAHRDPLSANPASKARFARPGDATMYYTGLTEDIAVWEVALRDKIFDSGRITVDESELAPWNIVQVELLRDVAYISLDFNELGHVAATIPTRNTLRQLCACDPMDYDETHDAARQLIAACTPAEALAWTSAQCGQDWCFLFYGPLGAPPYLRNDLFRIMRPPYGLGSDDGQALVNEVIERNGLVWAKAPDATA